MESEHRIVCGDDHLELHHERGQVSQVPWEEIASISVYKLDAFIKVVTFVVLDHARGEFFEIPNGTEGFDQLVDELPRRLDFSPAALHEAMEAAAPEEDSIVVFERD